MIKATLTESRLEAIGHAPRPEGASENLICAAVSALTQTARDAIYEIAGMTLSESHEASGHISFGWPHLTAGGRTILKAWELGMRNLAESYPGTIEIISEL